MQRYEKYKDSGVEWIGEIPEGWEVKKLKYVVSINDEALPETTDDNYEIEYVDISNVKSGVGILNTVTYSFDKAPSRARRIVRNGDIIVSTVRTYLKSISKIDNPESNLIVSTGFAVIRPIQVKSAFLGFIFYSEFMIGEIISRSTGVSYPAINSSEIGDIFIPVPQDIEQTTIANYLERKTAEIDQLIAQKEALLGLYEEEKTAIINQAVTQGINPYVKLKESGVDWLGEIPEHWGVKKFKYLYDLITDKNELGLPKIGLENIESKTGKFIASNTDFEGEGIHFKINDILFGKLRPYLAKVYLAKFEGKAIGDFYVFRCKEELTAKYSSNLILSKLFIDLTNKVRS